jgi:hypothetical protein
MENQFRHIDTKKADGVYVQFVRKLVEDRHCTPTDYLFQDEEYREQDEARLEAWRRNEWWFVGLLAEAQIMVVENGTGSIYEIVSPGLFGIESDSGEDYLNEVYTEECETLCRHIKMMATFTEVE